MNNIEELDQIKFQEIVGKLESYGRVAGFKNKDL
jgi:hypothetical protein